MLGLWLSRMNPNFTVGRMTSIFNAALFIVYFFKFDASTVIYSLLYMVLYTVSLDKFHYQMPASPFSPKNPASIRPS